ncbi:hypothetical protein B0A55_10329 [Friedmanniomyces simplex]|uniref:Uncharacterized protein n=1 Tax=Friedmanniomyces simplex TaxID=329884 RepID=A0A4U0WR98_9PEZI|nr:hypothetical protein B0A55_10329 [Friedmanniomyces simplex]
MAPTFTIDLSAISAQLTALLKSCMEKASESIKAEAKNERALTTKLEGSDIEGLREQILANATILLPLLRPDAITITTINGRSHHSHPKLHVIVSGQPSGDKAFVQAYVVYDQDASPKKAKLLYTEEASATAAGALQKLLGVSAQLIERNLFDNTLHLIEGHAVAVTGGGWCSPDGQHSPIILPSDFHFWNKSNAARSGGPAPSAAALSYPTSSPYVSSTSDTSFGSTGSAYVETEYNFGGSVKREDSFVDLSGLRGRGVAPNPEKAGSGVSGGHYGNGGGFNRTFTSDGRVRIF